MDYAASHAAVMASVRDLHIDRYDQAWAKDAHVLLRYTASGSHCGAPYRGIERIEPPRKARWSGACEGLVSAWVGAGLGEWSREMLADPEKARKAKE